MAFSALYTKTTCLALGTGYLVFGVGEYDSICSFVAVSKKFQAAHASTFCFSRRGHAHKLRNPPCWLLWVFQSKCKGPPFAPHFICRPFLQHLRAQKVPSFNSLWNRVYASRCMAHNSSRSIRYIFPENAYIHLLHFKKIVHYLIPHIDGFLNETHLDNLWFFLFFVS